MVWGMVWYETGYDKEWYETRFVNVWQGEKVL
jgi:hypothetical protein